MSASRRLPLATLVRASRSKRRPGRGRRLLTVMIILLMCAGAFWYFWNPTTTLETLPEVTESPSPDSVAADATPAPTDAFPFVPATTDGPIFSAASPPATTDGSSPVLARPTPPVAEPAPPAIPPPPPIEKDFRPRLPKDVFEAQIALARDAICPGSIDGAWGGQTRNAVAAFQQKHGLRVTGQLDNPTREAMRLREQPLRHVTITEEAISRLRPLPKGWLARSELDAMGYSTALEMVAEKSLTHPNQIKRLNPQVDWAAIKAGTQVVVPNIGTRATPRSRPEEIVISLGSKTLQLYDAESGLLAHFPCSIARRVEKRPVGELSILTVARNPNYTFNPETFPDSPEAQRIGRKLILQPGPNNPVGVAWIALSAGDGSYGIHGSPEPEQIGRTESSGCFRLANWNAEYLLSLVRAGMLVRVEP